MIAAADGVLRELESLGTEQNRKVYRRHGATGEVYGVSYADLKALAKRIKRGHALARELWASGVHDARVLAMMVADPAAATSEEVEGWADDLEGYAVTEALASFVARTPLVRDKAVEWSSSPEEWRGSAGWQLVAHLAMHDPDLPDGYFEEYLERIEREIEGAKNRTRYSMNNALIATGLRSEHLREEALAAAGRIGTVYVDHGETGCKTPDAVSYIHKAVARKQGK